MPCSGHCAATQTILLLTTRTFIRQRIFTSTDTGQIVTPAPEEEPAASLGVPGSPVAVPVGPTNVGPLFVDLGIQHLLQSPSLSLLSLIFSLYLTRYHRSPY